ncbi:tetratricopeptide repeat-containing diguanylate cyclase [Thiovibrio frasassiensis]|uniref:Tetratricopeptide repeat protein n=1 Tax=Thiovibrio frasassiensis TaxID=2984131 RepID=A0A9X4MGP0_9BACT|nr:tetratricopeptide repeat protein [Thiovibrio frasassiensis]MDG4475905.1 tetratricopeptide repeat protein [Thiovibrio frasassiensis]
MTIPLLFVAGPLIPADLHRFSTLFTKTAFDFFPCESAELIPLGEGEGKPPVELKAGLKLIRDNHLPVVDPEREELLLPIWGGETLCGLLVVRGGESQLYGMPLVWLDEQSHIISREFYLLKQSCQDPGTGLVNGFHLRGELEALLQEAAEAGALVVPATLALLEVYPRTRDADRSLRYIVRAGSCLASMLGEDMHLHHLGAGIFGLLWYGLDMEQARQMGDSLLLRLKRENFVTARLGITTVTPHDPEESGAPEQLLEQAWQALRTARLRGPFSLCGHVTARDIELHPFRKTSESVLRKLRALYRGKNRFSLVLVRMDQEPASNHFSKRLRTLVGQDQGLVLVSQREAFLFLDGLDGEAARAWLKEFRDKMEGIGGSSFSMGVATFPFHDFKKSDLPLNCRKALQHATFFGPDSLAVFDAVSLNISGDIYYNEGDLVKALGEYRQGLLLEPGNVNILNSMGVANIQLNRPKGARACFQKALGVAPENCMALFNLGFIYLEDGEPTEALALWERALAVDGDQPDLLQHLGMLYCRQGRYGEGRAALEGCEKLMRKKSSLGGEPMVVARWLGRACEALGDNGSAIAAYQRAVSGNPRDAGSLSRLGHLYAVEKQGQDIALALCGQAVELDGGKADHWYRFAQVQEMSQDQEGAMQSLSECLRLDPRQAKAALLLGRIFVQQGKPAKARKLYKKVLRYSPEFGPAQEALAALS